MKGSGKTHHEITELELSDGVAVQGQYGLAGVHLALVAHDRYNLRGEETL